MNSTRIPTVWPLHPGIACLLILVDLVVYFASAFPALRDGGASHWFAVLAVGGVVAWIEVEWRRCRSADAIARGVLASLLIAAPVRFMGVLFGAGSLLWFALRKFVSRD